MMLPFLLPIERMDACIYFPYGGAIIELLFCIRAVIVILAYVADADITFVAYSSLITYRYLFRSSHILSDIVGCLLLSSL